ncbi:MAG: hypothetical protein SGI92_16940 [Bryobacteraceae bacterium]|nr:hypothetical protein [Bryobacteraceae bacterium]
MATKKAAVKKGTTVRMYRQGLGDCFLVTLPGVHGPFHMLIDCGVVLGTEKPEAKMKPVVQDIIDFTGGRLDVLAVTHEHWDHVSGFLQANDLFTSGKLKVGEVWFAWTEDPKNKMGQRLRAERQARIQQLRAAVNGLTAAAESMGVEASPLAASIDDLVGLFGAASPGNTTSDALKVVRSLIPGQPRYLKPGGSPLEIDEIRQFRIYVMGPPEDEALIRKTDSTKGVFKDPSFGAAEAWAADSSTTPFDSSQCIPLTEATVRPGPVKQFFERYYFGKDTESVYSDQRWRRIDGDSFGPAAEMALALDSSTNNTSLVLAIEHIPSGKVLLFAADAQVGNWMSWQDVKWKVGEKEVTGPDLLRRTVLYKVGHHGSHNATLREQGLELMESEDLIAMLPVDHEMAVKKRWGRMPLPTLVNALVKQTKGRCLRIDEEFQSTDAAFLKRVRSTPLYHEVEPDLS